MKIRGTPAVPPFADTLRRLLTNLRLVFVLPPLRSWRGRSILLSTVWQDAEQEAARLILGWNYRGPLEVFRDSQKALVDDAHLGHLNQPLLAGKCALVTAPCSSRRSKHGNKAQNQMCSVMRCNLTVIALHIKSTRVLD